MQNEAYDFERFSSSTEEEHGQLRVIKNENKKKLRRLSLKGVRIAALIAVFLALVCSLLYSQTVLTELSLNIALSEKDLIEAKSEYTYLSHEMEIRTNVKNIEQRAAELGLVKMDPAQITYITVTNENKIVLAEDGAGKLLDNLKAGVMSFMEYMAP